jgi:hypothetical protein
MLSSRQKNNIRFLFAVSTRRRRIFCAKSVSGSSVYGTDMSLHRHLDEQTVLATAAVAAVNREE